MIVTLSGHYSWEKAVKILGIGTGQLVRLRIDGHMRMRMDHLVEELEMCLEQKQGVLAVIGVLGSTEFGSVDPIHKIVGTERAREALTWPAPHLTREYAWGLAAAPSLDS